MIESIVQSAHTKLFYKFLKYEHYYFMKVKIKVDFK
ncbi:hypothetical protein SAMN05216235_1045 [Salinicoccus halodurans]|uniref:Uncharacterized protein n=1 Tax=Salinicoccus halodurans TaxID=407035 RepID=A0AA94HDU3_9STAP|nr:hypothetical protein SAMN05216235_1045 [Salinicoccus halodurans]